jgi:hypothetical protein
MSFYPAIHGLGPPLEDSIVMAEITANEDPNKKEIILTNIRTSRVESRLLEYPPQPNSMRFPPMKMIGGS